MVRKQRRVSVKHRQVELVGHIGLDGAKRTSNAGDDYGLVRRPTKANLNVIVRKKILEKLSVVSLPGNPGLLFEINQGFFEPILVGLLFLPINPERES